MPIQVRVTEIESGKNYKDHERRVTVQLVGDDAGYRTELKVPESELGLGKVELDEVYTVIFSREIPGAHEMTTSVADAVEAGRKTRPARPATGG